MQDAIEAGSILIEPGTPAPGCWMPQGKPYSDGWISVAKLDRPEFEANIRNAGWTFFYLAGETRATVVGRAEQVTVDKAVKRLVARVKAQRFNGLEITRVVMSSFLGVPYATVTGHARHIQEGLVLSRPTTRQKPAGRLAAEARAELSHEVSEPMEVIV
jgi:hypothetical protein